MPYSSDTPNTPVVSSIDVSKPEPPDSLDSLMGVKRDSVGTGENPDTKFASPLDAAFADVNGSADTLDDATLSETLDALDGDESDDDEMQELLEDED